MGRYGDSFFADYSCMGDIVFYENMNTILT